MPKNLPGFQRDLAPGAFLPACSKCHYSTDLVAASAFADPQHAFTQERVWRDLEVLKCWPLSNATGSVEIRSVAEAEPSTEVSKALDRFTSGVRAFANDYDPVRVMGPCLVPLWINQRVYSGCTRGTNFLGRPMTNED